MKPDYAEARFNLGVTLVELGKYEEAEASCSQAIALKPDYAAAQFQKSLLLLKRQEFKLGWSLYDPPLNPKFDGAVHTYFTERAKRWEGSSLRGKNIQIYATQGIGDEIMFSSCIPDLIQESPSKMAFDCDPRLEPLFAECSVRQTRRLKGFNSPKTFSNTDEIK